MPGSWLVSDSELVGLHRHCYTCFNLKRCSREGDACGVVLCEAGCGARYHGCKGPEHELLCPLARVVCINSSFGCSVVLARRELVTHLPSCPASLLACTQEWNRWPLHCQERLKSVPFQQRNPRAARGQLDFELALRDQAVVGSLHKVPRRTKLALRNNLTRRFPALPLPRAGPDTRVADCSKKALREVSRGELVEGDQVTEARYGIAKVFLRNQEIQRRRWQEDVDTAILRTGCKVPKKYWEFPEQEKGNICSHCAYCYSTVCDKKYNYGGNDDDEKQSCTVVECSWGCGAIYHHCKAFEHQMLCGAHEGEGEYDWMHRHPEDDRVGLAALKTKAKQPNLARKKKEPLPPPIKAFPDLLAPPCLLPEVRKRAGGRPPPPPPPPQSLHTNMRFDIKMETVTRLQQKPRAMYTFLCGAELRRDQWEGHCRNVHSEIHGGLNNWLEARCPLSSYGCGFSARRLYPGTDPRAAVVYCQATQSFGVRPPPVAVRPGGDLSLVQLPVEVLQGVFSFLDPWSLASVALVSQHLREVASSLLDTRGCVALQWERREGPRQGWEVQYMRWFFSPYFQPIEHWGLHSEGAVSTHLQTCPYNIRTEHRRQEQGTQQAKDLMKALGVKMKLKQESEWFIK